MMARSDAALVARTRQGDGKAFDTLVRRHARAALAVAHAILGNQADAEDVCQDAWIRALERIEECREPERFVFWLMQIVRNRARNYVQYRRVRATESIEAAGGPAMFSALPDPSRCLQNERRRSDLDAALAVLPVHLREVLLLHDMAGWRHRAIAEDLGITEVLSRKRVMLARARMRQILGKAEGGAA